MEQEKEFLTQFRLVGFTRRQFLQGVAGTAVSLLLPTLIGCRGEEVVLSTPVPGTGPFSPFVQPLAISSNNKVLDTSFTIGMQQFSVPTQTNGTTATMTLRTIGFPDPNNPGQTQWGYPGPTFRVKPGDTIRLHVTNTLPKPPATSDPCTQLPTVTAPPAATPTATLHPQDHMPECFHNANTNNFHYHGMHVSPEAPADDVLLQIQPDGGQFQYDFLVPNNHPSGTFWYHPHNHGSTAVQVLNGMAGALIVEGDFDSVPEIANALDLVLVLQQIKEDVNLGQGGGGAPIILVNGVAQPVIQMRPNEVQRWRFIAATMQASAIVDLEFSGSSGTPTPLPAMYQIAQDGIQFSNDQWDSDVPADSFRLAPGNRADFLVQAPSTPGRYFLVQRPAAPHRLEDLAANTTPTPFPTPNPARGEEAALLAIEVVEDGNNYPTTLPQSLPPLPPFLAPITDAEINGRTRCLTFSVQGNPGDPPQFFINGTQFNPAQINMCMVLNTAEEWTIYNTSGLVHPFHIHVNPFVLTKVHDPALGDSSPMTWQDTILLPPAKIASGQCVDPGYVTIRHRFTDFTGRSVLHCHILGHEDRGMMQLLGYVESEEECPPGTGWQDFTNCNPCSTATPTAETGG